jgi:hypothetical protein
MNYGQSPRPARRGFIQQFAYDHPEDYAVDDDFDEVNYPRLTDHYRRTEDETRTSQA